MTESQPLFFLESTDADERTWFTTVGPPALQLWPVQQRHREIAQALLATVGHKLRRLGGAQPPAALDLDLWDLRAVPGWSGFEAENQTDGQPFWIALEWHPAPDSPSPVPANAPLFLTPMPLSEVDHRDRWLVAWAAQLGLNAPAPWDPAGYDQAFAALGARLRQALPDLRARFCAGLPQGQSLQFLIELPDGDGGQHRVWVEACDWSTAKTVTCALLEVPEAIPGLARGERCTWPVDQLLDYALNAADGDTLEGAESDQIAWRFGLWT